jgi:uncharacterized protein YggE
MQSLSQTITVTGSATVSLPPDQARISGNVQTQADTAEDAANQNSRILQAVIDAVRATGVPAMGIVTTAFNVAPQYSRIEPQPGEASLPPTVVGYQATTGITVTTDQLDQVSDILQAMVSAGVTNLNGPSYQLKHPDQLQLMAEQQASANAMQRAQAIAAGLDVKVGDVVTANEGNGVVSPVRVPTTAPAPPPPPPAATSPAGGTRTAPPPVLPPSTITASTQVTVVFAIVLPAQPAGTTGP